MSETSLHSSSEDPRVEEWIQGRQELSPRPAIPHAQVASRLGSLLMPPYSFQLDGPGGWYLLDEPELHLGDTPDILVPDLAGWLLEHVDDHVTQPAFVTVRPDWVCEVISPSTARLDRTGKMQIYAREGVGHVWLVDPSTQLIEVFQWEQGRYVLLRTYGEQTPTDLPPFGPVRLDLLWSAVR